VAAVLAYLLAINFLNNSSAIDNKQGKQRMTQQSSFCYEVDRQSASQGIPHILWKPEVDYRVPKNLALVGTFVLSQMSPVHRLPLNLDSYYYHHPSMFPKLLIFYVLLLVNIKRAKCYVQLLVHERVVPEKLIVAKLLWNTHVFYVTNVFITVNTTSNTGKHCKPDESGLPSDTP
jgi:hypothetical protein